MSEINQVLNETRQTKNAIDSQFALNGSVDPLLEARLQKLENKLNLLNAKNSGVSENIAGLDPQGIYREAFLQYLKKGDVAGISKLPSPRVQLNDTGFTVAPTMEQMITDGVANLSVMRKIASVTQISYDSLDLAVESTSNKASWGAPTANTTVVNQYIRVYDVVAQPKMTAKLLEDSEIDVEGYIAGKIAESFVRAEDESFLSGNGVDKPTGILTLAAGTSATQIQTTTGAITFANLMTLTSTLDPFYALKTAYLMHLSTEAAIRLLQDTGGRYIWTPADKVGEPNRILGVPVYTTNFMPTGAGARSILFGNFNQGYQVVERVGINILRDPFTEKPFVKFYTLRRVGGGVLDGRALKALVQA
jgi:HK97 family phage major capsid protein